MNNLTKRALANQLNAMDCDYYSLAYYGTFKTGQKGMAYKKDKDKNVINYTKEQLLDDKFISYLRYLNNDFDIYIKPSVDYPNKLLSLDDVDKQTIDKMISKGYQPCLVVETSPHNYQVHLKMPSVVDDDIKDKMQRLLINHYETDKGATGLNRLWRLGGFTNKKDKHKDARGYQPFVKVISSSGQTFSSFDKLHAYAKKQLEEVQAHQVQVQSKAVIEHTSYTLTSEGKSDRQRQSHQLDLDYEVSKFYQNRTSEDMSKVDFALFSKLVAWGVDDYEIKDLWVKHRPNEDNKHQNVDYYVDLTLSKVHAVVSPVQYNRDDEEHRLGY